MSGIKVLLDTNLVIGLLKGYPDAIAIFTTEHLSVENCAISQITPMELLSYPRLQPEEERSIRDLLASLLVINLDEIIEQEAIQFRRNQNVKLPDAIVAASAIVYGLRLLTLDRELAAKFTAYIT